jgi:glycine dehydrogenase
MNYRLMVTYSTHGVFESAIREITVKLSMTMVDYLYDGANMNAQGLTNPATIF